MRATVLAPSTEHPPTPERILQRLDWQVIRRLDGLLQGDYRTLFTDRALISPIYASINCGMTFATSTGM